MGSRQMESDGLDLVTHVARARRGGIIYDEVDNARRSRPGPVTDLERLVRIQSTSKHRDTMLVGKNEAERLEI